MRRVNKTRKERSDGKSKNEQREDRKEKGRSRDHENRTINDGKYRKKRKTRKTKENTRV